MHMHTKSRVGDSEQNPLRATDLRVCLVPKGRLITAQGDASHDRRLRPWPWGKYKPVSRIQAWAKTEGYNPPTNGNTSVDTLKEETNCTARICSALPNSGSFPKREALW